MIDLINFKVWLTNNKDYSEKTVSNIVSRFKRVNSLLPWENNELYFFHLEQLEDFKDLSKSVCSQLKQAAKLYSEFILLSDEQNIRKENNKINALSLFANIGVAEAYLEDIGIDVVVANELEERRAILYQKIYPKSHMICGDITDKSIEDKIIKESKEKKVDLVMATPPCQGMSTAGYQKENDDRNRLICQVIDIVNRVEPKYVFIENVALFYNTAIIVNDEKILIPDLINKELGNQYKINKYTINTKDYSVPQTRERAIMLLTRKDIKTIWTLPQKDEKVVTMFDAIGDLPPLDPFVKDIDEEELIKLFPHYHERKEKALKISKWHTPPHHIKRQVVAMQHTATGKTAFDNEVYYPTKANGEAVKGYRNTYKRQNWDTPAYTVTMDNRKISSQNNVHPGRIESKNSNGENIYSDARTLTLYELMIIMSLPVDWNVPSNTSDAFLRRIIGEGIPPLFVKKVFEKLV
ncbi:DNA cytosine methyltransferase (plasmid) [Lactococcus lactis subsp. lactis]|uniref:DNA (cytosine-5-)-methyltransferase n=1 Tax=Lactococcus lactis TaxID=1358 RepID=Q6QPZ2_9LACT|nr:DNA cytosine methyltransferase [Lactococcus lactis]AAS99177.1 M1.LlaJI [Lactococcus lactis]QTP13236.1 DNA cytosine methyltransferase [Lactococcus lactis subsp. lactis]